MNTHEREYLKKIGDHLPLHLSVADFLECCGWQVDRLTQYATKNERSLLFDNVSSAKELLSYSLQQRDIDFDIPAWEFIPRTDATYPPPLPAVKQETGWECPVCHEVWAPSVLRCPSNHPRKPEELRK